MNTTSAAAANADTEAIRLLTAEVERLRAELAAERALADSLADALELELEGADHYAYTEWQEARFS